VLTRSFALPVRPRTGRYGRPRDPESPPGSSATRNAPRATGSTAAAQMLLRHESVSTTERIFTRTSTTFETPSASSRGEEVFSSAPRKNAVFPFQLDITPVIEC
jgi:hypothetical protein